MCRISPYSIHGTARFRSSSYSESRGSIECLSGWNEERILIPVSSLWLWFYFESRFIRLIGEVRIDICDRPSSVQVPLSYRRREGLWSSWLDNGGAGQKKLSVAGSIGIRLAEAPQGIKGTGRSHCAPEDSHTQEHPDVRQAALIAHAEADRCEANQCTEYVLLILGSGINPLMVSSRSAK